MGQCGCGENMADRTLSAGGGNKWGVTVYGGCPDCQTPAGVSFDFWEASEVRYACPDVRDLGKHSGIPIADAAILKKRTIKAFKDAGLLRAEIDGDTISDDEAADMIDWYELLGAVVFDTFAEYEKQTRGNGRKRKDHPHA